MKNFTRTAIFTCMFVLCFVTESVSQSPFFVGLRGGAVFSNPSISNSVDNNLSHAINMCVGGILGFRMSETFAVITEPSYVRKGVNFLVFGEYAESLEADYLEIPVVMQASSHWNHLMLHFYAGPSVAWKLSEAFHYNPNLAHAAVVRDYYSSTDLSVMVGTGVTFWVTNGVGILVDFRFARGLNIVSNIGPETMRSSEVTIGGGLLFDL